MTIIRPDQLFDQADRLARGSAGQQVDLRRAVSSAYYGLFHTATITVADYVVGKSRRNSAEWSLACRSVDHKKLLEVCEAIDKNPPPLRFRPLLPESLISSGFKDYARAVIEFQEKRHQADYDPAILFKVSDVRSIVSTAKAAYARFSAITEEERRTFVCLLIFSPRR
jgi:hypothetical protein